ncbi:MAG TPA: di-heme-cytochrome C peroxidase [Pyrinomonadaceae bacterium]
MNLQTLDQTLVAKGALVYRQKDPTHGNQSCEDCHGINKGKFRSVFRESWATPILDVGTDSREINLLSSQVKTGVLEGASIFGSAPLKAVDSAISVLKLSVAGSILQHYFILGLPGGKEGQPGQLKDTWQPKAAAAPGSATATLNQSFPYESRVMQGIWAAAPYLHNGSVPTLAELLTPAAQRVPEFMIGPAYDIDKVGLAVQQTKFNYTLKTTDCSDRNSGNSRCGHDFGTNFSDGDKRALLEYLKSL